MFVLSFATSVCKEGSILSTFFNSKLLHLDVSLSKLVDEYIYIRLNKKGKRNFRLPFWEARRSKSESHIKQRIVIIMTIRHSYHLLLLTRPSQSIPINPPFFFSFSLFSYTINCFAKPFHTMQEKINLGLFQLSLFLLG